MEAYRDQNNCSGSEGDASFLFASIFDKHQQKIYRLAFRATKSHQHANDIVQEVFMKLWEHRSSIGEIKNIDAWLVRAVKNKVIDFLRKVAADDRLKASLWRKIEQKQAALDSPLEAKESEQLMHEAVDALPAQRKMVYRLNRETGLSYQEIADELSISRHTVKNQLYLALRFVQQRLSV